MYWQMALYADPQRGRYPVWQSLDVEGFFPGSGIVFVTVTVSPLSFRVAPQASSYSAYSTVQGDFSKRIESLPDSEVQSEVLGVLRAMFPNTTIPDPLDFHFPRWNANPLYRGSYSNWPPSFFSQHHQNLRATVEDRLWFAGEATSQKYFGEYHTCFTHRAVPFIND